MSKPVIAALLALWLTLATLIVDVLGLTSSGSIIGGGMGNDATSSAVSSGIDTLLNMLFFQVESVPPLVNILLFWVPMVGLLWMLLELIIAFLNAVIPL
jgi:hypothetical protein